MAGMLFILGLIALLAGAGIRHDVGGVLFVLGILLLAGGYVGAFL